MAIAALVLIGWSVGNVTLKQVFPGLVAMNPLTAVGFLIAGVSLVLLRVGGSKAAHHVGHILGYLVALIGLLRLAEYDRLFNFGIDQILFTAELKGNMMAPNTALSFVFIGLALGVLDATSRRGTRPAETLNILVGFLSLTALLGYAYEVQPFYRFSVFIPMALHTALCFQLLCMGVFCARPDGGLMRIVTSQDADGVLVRRLLPITFLAPALLGWIQLKGEKMGLYSAEMGDALQMAALVAIFSFLIWSCARTFRQSEIRRKRAEERLRRSEEDLDVTLHSIGDAVLATDIRGCVTRMNAVAEELTGWSHGEAHGRPIAEVFHIIDEVTQRPGIIPVDSVLATGEIRTLSDHTALIARDGTRRPIADSAAPIHDREGRVQGVVLVFRDVTNEKKAEEIRERLAAIVESSDDAIVSKSLNGIVTSWNPGAERLFGYTAQEIVGTPLTRIFPKDRIDEEPGILARLKKGDRVEHFETVRVAKDGRCLDVSVTISPVKDKAGQVIGASTIMRDITEKKLAEEKLRRSEEHLAVTLQSIGDAVVVTDSRGQITSLNPVAEKLTGWKRVEALGRPAGEVIHLVRGETGQPAELPVARVLATGEVYLARGHVLLTGRHGVECPIAESAAPIRDRQGDVLGVVLVLRDVTEERRAQEAIRKLNAGLELRVRERTAELELTNQALHASEERLRLMIESVQDYAIFMLDTAGRVVNWNPGAQRMQGYAGKEIIGQSFECFYPEEVSRQSLAERDLHQAQTQGRFETEGWRARKDGSRFWANVTLTPLFDDTRQLRGFCHIARDMTERRMAEEEIRTLNADLERRVHERTQQLEAANKELESFSYTVSHDLRAPLRHVQGYVEMLAREASGALTDKAQHYMRTIREASTEMGQLIDDLLAFSRMGRTEMQDKPVSLDELIRGTVQKLEMATEGRNIRWNIAPLPDVSGDPAMLRQVFANLMGNAVKYSRDRNPAEIEIGSMGQENGRLVLYVRDNGAGFDMKYAHKLFGVFQRLHRGEEFEGTGIGLATVRRIIARHGGRVWAEGRVDQGATFYFTLKPAESLTALCS